MLQDSSFRKTAKCSYYKIFLATKSVPEFPIQRLPAEGLDTRKLINATSSSKPFVVVGDTTKTGSKLGLILPDRDKDLVYVSSIVGPATPVKIIEVGQQTEITDWTLGEYAQYLKNYSADDHKILNMITLEFSASPLNSKVTAPTFVRSLDWIDTIWPLDRRARGDYPKVQKYCLAGMAGSYTDFHIDFGGTSVWYHVLTGRKKFYLVPPTTANLRAFEKWTTSSAQADVFFGDLLGPGQCFQFDLSPGETFIIPSGWIHAVFTPVDSLVFGGNFVHSYAILRQLQIYSIEHRTRVQKAYRFPFFRQINWYFLCTMLPLAQEMYPADAAAPQASWVTMLEDGDEDSDDEDDDLQATCKSFADPVVFYQLPYLVKTCELWHRAGEDRQEKRVFESGLRDSGCETVEQVLAVWWTLLPAVARRLKAQAVRAESDGDGKLSGEVRRDNAVSHVQTIQAMRTLDLLDDAVVRPVFHSFETDLRQLLPSAVPAPVATAAGASMVAAVSPVAVPAASKTAVKTELASDKAPPSVKLTAAEPLKFKFTLKASASSTAAAVPAPTAVAPAVVEPVRSPSVRPAEAVVKPAAKEKKAVSLKLTMGQPKAKAPTNYNVEKSVESASSGRYGTRGLKLSADFLSRAMDVEVGRNGAVADSDREEDEMSASDAAEDADDGEYSAGEGDARSGEDRKSSSRQPRTKTSGASSSGSSSGGGAAFVFQDRDGGRKAVDEEWQAGHGNHQQDEEDHHIDSDATEFLSDEEPQASAHKKRKLAATVTAAARPQYVVDRVSEYAQYGAGAVTHVPQIQGVRSALGGGSKPKASALNNRQKILKKLGLK